MGGQRTDIPFLSPKQGLTSYSNQVWASVEAPSSKFLRKCPGRDGRTVPWDHSGGCGEQKGVAIPSIPDLAWAQVS